MSNENCKHHENWEKVEGGLTRTFQGTLFLILLCKVTGAGDFENHIYFRDSQENFLSINPSMCPHLRTILDKEQIWKNGLCAKKVAGLK